MTSKAAAQLQVQNDQRVLSFEDILGATDINDETIPVPEWGGSVVVRPLTKRVQRDIRRDSKVTIAGPSGAPVEEIDEDRLELLLFQRGMVEPKVTLEQAEQLLDRSASAFDRVLSAITKNSGMNTSAIVDAERNFPTE